MKKKYNIKLLKKHIEREERTDGSFEVNTKQESSKSENEDVMGSCYEEKEKFFNHVDERWQMEKACHFSRTLNLIEINPKQDIIKELSLNPRVTKLKGDGNCHFRSICLTLTGSQRQHNVVRDDIVKWMNENYKLIKNNFGQKYLEESNMELDGEWATEAEVLSTAAFLNTDIEILCRIGDACKSRAEWLCYKSNKLGKPVKSKKKIYLSNILGIHFDFVQSMDLNL